MVQEYCEPCSSGAEEDVERDAWNDLEGERTVVSLPRCEYACTNLPRVPQA